MKCPKCGSFDTSRVRRKTLDQVWAWFGQWPFRCRACSHHFHRGSRDGSPKELKQTGENRRERYESPIRGQVQVKTHPEEPMAGIVVRAESQSELNHILLTLSEALNSYGNANRPEFKSEKVKR